MYRNERKKGLRYLIYFLIIAIICVNISYLWSKLSKNKKDTTTILNNEKTIVTFNKEDTTNMIHKEDTTKTLNKEHTTKIFNKEHTTNTFNKEHTTNTFKKEHTTNTSNKEHTTITSNKEHTTSTSNKEHTTKTSNKEHTTNIFNNEREMQKSEKTSTKEPKERSRPNILFILADDLGFNDVGYHGSEIKTPNLDELAMSGVRLENYYVQPICTPTRSQLLSGRYQIHTGLQSGVIWPLEPSSLPLDSKTIADKLSDAGYSTHMVGKWHLGYHKSEYLPTRRGFHSFFGFLNGHNDYFTYTSRFKGYFGFDLRENEEPADMKKYTGKYSTNVFARKVIDLFEGHKSDKPQFVFLSFQAPHDPLQVPQHYTKKYEFIQEERRRIYAGMVTCMDEAVGNITKALKEMGKWDNTLLIFSTDNGASHGCGSNKPLRGIKGNFWEGAIRAVGFVHGNLLNQSVQGTVSRELLHVTDWFPTLVNLAGGDLNGTKPLDGYDQWLTINDGKKSKRSEILINIDPTKVLPERPKYRYTFDTRIRAGLRQGKWKLITGIKTGGPVKMSMDRQVWLFDIEKDPYEYKDLSRRYPGIVQQMLKRLEYYQSTAVPVIKPKLDRKGKPSRHGGFWGPWLD